MSSKFSLTPSTPKFKEGTEYWTVDHAGKGATRLFKQDAFVIPGGNYQDQIFYVASEDDLAEIWTIDKNGFKVIKKERIK